MAMTSDRLEVVIPADHVPGPKQGHWTYSHYAVLPDEGQRYEIVDGVLYMAPAPGRWHQNAVFEIASYLRTYVRLAGLGEVYIAPFDVQLTSNVVVQPDVIVVLNANLGKINDSRIIGAPDLVVEVASPGTNTYDRRQKYDVYARAGVSEYWLADPGTRTVEVLHLENGKYQLLGIFKEQEMLLSKVVPDVSSVSVNLFFAPSGK